MEQLLQQPVRPVPDTYLLRCLAAQLLSLLWTLMNRHGSRPSSVTRGPVENDVADDLAGTAYVHPPSSSGLQTARPLRLYAPGSFALATRARAARAR